MINFSPRRIAVFLAIISVLLSGMFFLIARITEGLFYPFIGGVLVVFFSIYFLSKYFLDLFLVRKINPLYRIVLNKKFSVKEKGLLENSQDLIEKVKIDVTNWETDKKSEIDQLKQLEKYRREFLGNVSHELKTPIFNIQGYILTLLDGGLSDPTINRLYLERTEKSINRMINIVEDLESISRLESGELTLELTDFDIVALVSEVFEMQEMLVRQKNISLEIDKFSAKQIFVNADRQRINEVLINLIVNSIKYGKKHGNTRVAFYDMDDKVMVEVTDNGIGIQEKDIPRIFERFYRTDKSRSRDQGGTGLGLSIVKHIIEAHQQTINVRSIFGEGSSFSFTLNKSGKH